MSSPGHERHVYEDSSAPTLRPATTVVPPDEHLLGLKRGSLSRHHIPPQVFSDDYEKGLPPDEYGEELSPNARVWRAYEQEATTYDTAMIRQSRDGLDVMLVFAGLFSAVVTSFLVQVSQNLMPDSSGMTAILLHDMVVLQIQAGDASAANITVPSVDPFTSKGDPTALDLWMNALWAVSLTASLIVALSAVLVKQWLHRYITLPSGTPGLRSHIRHFRFVGFEEWHVEAIIGTLPVIMHLSLGLFFVGLILFFVPLCVPLACTLAAISVLVLVLYITSNALPLFYPQCPYQTPLTDFSPFLIRGATKGRGKVVIVSNACMRKISTGLARNFLGRTVLRALSATKTIISLVLRTLLPVQEGPGDAVRSNLTRTTREREECAVRLSYDHLSVDALHWVFHVTANPTLHSVVLQSIGALPSDILEYAHPKWDDDLDMKARRDDLLRRCSIWQLGQEQYRPGDEAETERLCRSLVALPRERFWGRHNDLWISPGATGDFSRELNRASLHRLQAALLLACFTEGTGVEDFLGQAVEPVFLQISHAILHVNLWRELVLETLTTVFKQWLLDFDQLWPKVLYAAVLRPDLDWSQYASEQSHMMTLTQALQFTPLRAEVFNFLVTRHPLTEFRHESRHALQLSPEVEVLVCLWRLAVHVLSNILSGAESRNFRNIVHYRQLLHYAMSLVCHPQAPDRRRSYSLRSRTHFQALPDVRLLSQLVHSVLSITFPPEGSSAIVDILDDDCMNTLLDQYYEISRYEEAFTYPSFQCIIDARMQYMLLVNGSDFKLGAPISNPPWNADRIMSIMATALWRGRDDAFAAFMGYDWPKLVYELHTLGHTRALSRLLYAFIKGLRCVSHADKRAAYTTFVLAPRNVLLLSVAMDGVGDVLFFRFLHERSPTHPCWVGVLGTLRALHAWHRHHHRHNHIDNRAEPVDNGIDDADVSTKVAVPLYPAVLNDLAGEKVLRDSDRSVSTSLDDAVWQRLERPESELDDRVVAHLEEHVRTH